MAKFLNTESLGYDDVVLIAQPGKVDSRNQIPVEGNRIVVSAMTSIICPEFLTAVSLLPSNYQPTIHIPRDIYAEENIKLSYDLGLKNIFIGLGLNTPHLEELARYYKYNTVLLDVANGYLPNVKEKVKDLKEQGFVVVVGSVHTERGAIDLYNAGANVIRSGIGPGSACLTSSTAGYTRSPISDILALVEGKFIGEENFQDEMFDTLYIRNNYSILADGGFSNVSHVTKAFLAGADYIMTGRLFVDAEEARLRVDKSDVYYGMASAMGKKVMGKEIKNIEGKEQKLSRENLRPLKEIIQDIWDGIRSAVSYSGYATLTEAIGNGVFEIKHK